MAADNLLSWTGEDGAERCLLIVTDDSKQHNQHGYQKIELCKKNNDDEWETDEIVDAISDIESFGIPPGMDR